MTGCVSCATVVTAGGPSCPDCSAGATLPGPPPDRVDGVRVDSRARWGAAVVLAAVLVFIAAFVTVLGASGTSYVWHTNLLSDLGDTACRVRGGRWICSPSFALFNAGLVLTGTLLAGAAVCLRLLWGRLLAGSVTVMGVGLVVAGLFPAGDTAAIHLTGVVLGLVVPGLGLLLAAIRPETAWLGGFRITRGVLGVTALLWCAESRLPDALAPRGAGELLIVGCLISALVLEALRVLLAPRASRRVTRSGDGTPATANPSH